MTTKKLSYFLLFTLILLLNCKPNEEPKPEPITTGRIKFELKDNITTKPLKEAIIVIAKNEYLLNNPDEDNLPELGSTDSLGIFISNELEQGDYVYRITLLTDEKMLYSVDIASVPIIANDTFELKLAMKGLDLSSL